MSQEPLDKVMFWDGIILLVLLIVLCTASIPAAVIETAHAEWELLSTLRNCSPSDEVKNILRKNPVDEDVR